MKLAWLGVILIGGVLLIFLLRAKNIYESFKEKKEGFTSLQTHEQDIVLSACPVNTVSFVDDGGRTMCCEEKLVGGKCPIKPICSLSESVAGSPTCGDWYAAVLDKKGAMKCPPSMPNYYESSNGAGCTAGKRTPSGTGPLNTTDKFCKLYTSETDDITKVDSCTNVKYFETSPCFTRSFNDTHKSFSVWRSDLPPVIYCSRFDTATLTPSSCITNDSFIRIVDYWVAKFNPTFTNWKTDSTGWGSSWKMNFCSAVQRVNMDRNLSMAELEKLKIF